MVVRVRFPCKNPSYIYQHHQYDHGRSVFRDLRVRRARSQALVVLLAMAWKMNGSLSYIVVNALVELASYSARHPGGKLAITAPVHGIRFIQDGGVNYHPIAIDA